VTAVAFVASSVAGQVTVATFVTAVAAVQLGVQASPSNNITSSISV